MHSIWGILVRELIQSLRADIQYLCMYKGHTAKEIAETANVHVTTVYDFLRGDEHCNPTIGTLYALAQAVEEVS